MNAEQLNTFADYILLIGLIPATVFFVDFVIIRPFRKYLPWWQSPVGRMFAFLALANVLLTGNVLASLFLGVEYPGRPLFRLVGYSAFTLAMVQLVITYYIERRSALPVLFVGKERTEMSNLTPGPDHAAGVDPTEPSAPGFLARSKKALAGGIAGLVTGGLGSAISAAFSDGTVTGAEGWQILGVAIGGFLVGFATVWVAPKNEEPTGSGDV